MLLGANGAVRHLRGSPPFTYLPSFDVLKFIEHHSVLLQTCENASETPFKRETE